MTGAFLLYSFLLGAGLSMDAFSVSLADGLRDPRMSVRRMCATAGTYGAFQACMPLAGRGLVRFAAARLTWFGRWIPWAGAGLLVWMGCRMVRDGLRGVPDARPRRRTLLLQGFATSVDALSVGFGLAARTLPAALTASGIIAAVTFCDCMVALAVGKRFGLRFSAQASVTGGLVLLGIGVEMALSEIISSGLAA